jgi:hypothetical protein
MGKWLHINGFIMGNFDTQKGWLAMLFGYWAMLVMYIHIVMEFFPFHIDFAVT